MGVADMLIKMGITYGSELAQITCAEISNCLLNSAFYASVNLAATNGHSFPMYDYNKLCKSEFYQQMISPDNKKYAASYGLYNSQLLTIAPTGTLSTMIGISGGVEPIFAKYYTRKTESLHGKDVEYKVYTPIVKQYMDANNITDDSELPEFFITSAEINPIDRVKMQAAWQQSIDASISSTVNLPEESTIEDVADVYLNAYQYGLKGITVFRSGCRRAAILTVGKKDNNESSVQESNVLSGSSSLPRGYIIEANDNLVGKKRKLITGCGSLHCTAFFDPKNGALMETYLSRGSTGGCANSYTGLSRMISLAARAGVSIDAIIDQLNSCGVCPAYAVRSAKTHDTSPGACCPIAIGKALKSMWEEMNQELQSNGILSELDQQQVESIDPKGVVTACPECEDVCPECGQPLVHVNGCIQCTNCAWSKCN